MNCTQNITLLSDFHDGMLNERETGRVRAHLMMCRSCRELSQDLERIITAAAELRDESCATCPNEEASWRRFEVVKLAALKSTDVPGGRQWLRR
jgi:predicted anti-sigma-YlaC factor YlaD